MAKISVVDFPKLAAPAQRGLAAAGVQHLEQLIKILRSRGQAVAWHRTECTQSAPSRS